MNKRADMTVMLLVFIALFLVCLSLFTFIFYNRISANIADSRFIEKSLKKEGAVENAMFLEGYNRVIQTYYNAAINYKLGSTPDLIIQEFTIKDIDGKDRKINTEKKNDLFILKTNFDDVEEINTKDDNGKGLNMLLKYSIPISIDINLTEIGLHDFSYIDTSINKCRSQKEVDEVKSCLQNALNNFEINVEDKQDGKHIDLKSKRLFNVNGNIEQIELNMVV
jgi:hypothetical protein